MKYSELVKLLKKAGCYLERHGANHDIWRSPITGKTIILPRHQSEEVKRGTLKEISRRAGL
ncbi:MAG: type II toxin-antitoxin system HicA family toxin [Muribaculaceae bacterium]|nr:type II toxin-antitoxin system HicA family toxin [Muribaculaceae bacterium]